MIMNEMDYNENSPIDLSETINDFESESLEQSNLNEEFSLAETEEEEIERYAKVIRELTEFEESQSSCENTGEN